MNTTENTGTESARADSPATHGSAPPSYEIKTVQDFLLVPEDRLEACLTEFRDYLEYARDIAELAKLTGEIIGAKETQTTVGSFNWTDDGIRKGTIRIETKVEQNASAELPPPSGSASTQGAVGG